MYVAFYFIWNMPNWKLVEEKCNLLRCAHAIISLERETVVL